MNGDWEDSGQWMLGTAGSKIPVDVRLPQLHIPRLCQYSQQARTNTISPIDDTDLYIL